MRREKADGSSQSTWSGRDWAVLAALAFLPFFFFPHAVSGDTSVVVGDGIIELPYRIAAARQAFSGEWPFWSPYMLGGAPLWSYPTAGALSPLTYLFGILPTFWTLNILWLLVGSMALAGTYAFARAWGIGMWGSVAASLSYSFSGFFYSYIDFNVHGMTQSAAFLPLLLAAYYRLGRRPSPRRAALAAVATFFMGVIPQDQLFFYSMLHAGFVTLFCAVSAPKSDRRRALAWGAAAALLGTAALSVRILPTMHLIKYSAREGATVWLYNAFKPHNVAKWHTLFNPFEDDQRLASLYFGEIPFFLAMIALRSIRRSRRALWAAAGFLLGLAGVSWVYIPPEWLEGLPVLGWFHSPFRHLFELFFWASILAGMGMDMLARNEGRNRRVFIGAFAFTALVGLVIVAALNLTGHYRQVATSKWPSLLTLALFFAVAAILLFASRKKAAGTISPLPWPLILLLLAALATPRAFIFKHFVNKRIGVSGRIENPDRSPVVDFLREREHRLGMKPPMSRGIYLGYFYNRFYSLADRVGGASPNTNMAFRFPLVQAKEELVSKRLEYFMRKGMRNGLFMDTSIFSRSGLALDLLNTRYVLLSKVVPPDWGVKSWPLYRDYIIENHDEMLSITIATGEEMEAKLDPREGTEAIGVVISHLEKSIPKGARVAEISLEGENSNGMALIVSAGVAKDGITPLERTARRANKDGLQVSEKAWFYAIQLPMPHSGGATLKITALAPGATIAVNGGAMLAQNGDVISRLPLIESYLETTFHYHRIYENGSVMVFERGTALPRQWLARWVRVADAERILGALASPGGRAASGDDVGPAVTALVEDDRLAEFGGRMLSAPPDEKARIERVVNRPNYISARVSGDAPVFAVFSEPWAEGWSATLDGKPVHIYIADFYLRGVPVPPGEHVIEMRYRPPGLATGAIMSLFALAMIIFLAFSSAVTPPSRRQ